MFYAELQPGGFATEVQVHVFDSAKARNTWVSENKVNYLRPNQYCGILPSKAYRWLLTNRISRKRDVSIFTH